MTQVCLGSHTLLSLYWQVYVGPPLHTQHPPLSFVQAPQPTAKFPLQ